MSKEDGGAGFFGLMFLLFLGLKLGHVIDWAWIWVFAPLWGPAGLAVIALIIWAIWMFAGAYKRKRDLRKLEKRWFKK